jgi:hypothetical protein
MLYQDGILCVPDFDFGSQPPLFLAGDAVGLGSGSAASGAGAGVGGRILSLPKTSLGWGRLVASLAKSTAIRSDRVLRAMLSCDRAFFCCQDGSCNPYAGDENTLLFRLAPSPPRSFPPAPKGPALHCDCHGDPLPALDCKGLASHSSGDIPPGGRLPHGHW